ncbi:MAG: TatD family deoxyribonuclease [Chloroflexi bacterium]|nr:TatD family deoxyribonuclease [Chloroflexota bacterium]
MELFDSHTHLESHRFDPDRAEVIARARAAGVTRLLTCGADLETSGQGIALARAHAGIHAAAGIHAHEASSALVQGQEQPGAPILDDAAFRRLAALATLPEVVAIGEIGLDYHHDLSPRPAQRAVLARQLLLARELDLPVILHNRESDGDLRELVGASPDGLRGVLHCFLADATLAEWALARGLYIGVAGPITFRNIGDLPEVIRRVPLERLLIETDCPYLAPEPHRGRRNEPAYVRYVADKLAELRGISTEELARRTTENACRLFRIA